MISGWKPTGRDGYLNITNGVDRAVADIVIDKAAALRSDERRQFLKDIEVAVHNGVASAFKS